ncbi:hypothetical protein [Flammeovirga pacifica]|uniref:Uncharacterized protein n=1 Tax=Flammeovirga pacifica TaxID=915059 RepID=A0A1S1YYD8_FLAPC|nr:hypothetical protein [Flammeovirga pacifica]OHX66022.1 hypothetical protein NH26_06470 [Flammeovirga pacifica]
MYSSKYLYSLIISFIFIGHINAQEIKNNLKISHSKETTTLTWVDHSKEDYPYEIQTSEDKIHWQHESVTANDQGIYQYSIATKNNTEIYYKVIKWETDYLCVVLSQGNTNQLADKNVVIKKEKDGFFIEGKKDETIGIIVLDANGNLEFQEPYGKINKFYKLGSGEHFVKVSVGGVVEFEKINIK